MRVRTRLIARQTRIRESDS